MQESLRGKWPSLPTVLLKELKVPNTKSVEIMDSYFPFAQNGGRTPRKGNRNRSSFVSRFPSRNLRFLSSVSKQNFGAQDSLAEALSNKNDRIPKGKIMDGRKEWNYCFHYSLPTI